MAYTKRIEVQRLTVTTDSIGNRKKSWETLCRPWASVFSVSGKEYYAAAQVNEENDVTFRLRWSRLLSQYSAAQLRVLYNGRSYDVRRLTDYREMHQFFEIKAVQVNGSE